MVKLGAGEMNEVLKFFFHEIFEFVHIVGLFLLFLGEFLDDWLPVFIGDCFGRCFLSC